MIEEAIRLIGEGQSVKATAATLSVPKSRLDRARKTQPGLDAAMREAAQRYRNRGWNPELLDQAAELLESGTPILTAAKQLHLGSETMHHYRKAHPRLDAALRAVEERRSQRTGD
ncbi:hypothetical protein O1R50_03395 [Glycomyces luteolus]|uniref:Helix-turn-helix domain-containing protein n=1 Tax=Glycomyces luteolus TaxID=2670330 RepID=A0A9X3P8G2_9ACTN|nr:hypothetical protein [Glycomyces luteolus]MDA1358650.1 hypothetical protein [Glycomyces luteolus]